MDTLRFRRLLPDEIEVRIGSTGTGYIDLLLYKTARVDAQILIETVGQNWTNDTKVVKDVLWAGIGIINPENGEYIWRWSAGTESNMEKQKGEDSDSFKRAAFRWGIGSELYTAPQIRLWENEGKYKPIKNGNGKSGTYDKFEVKSIETDDLGRITKLLIINTSTNKAVCSFGFSDVADAKDSIKSAQSRKEEIIKALKEQES